MINERRIAQLFNWKIARVVLGVCSDGPIFWERCRFTGAELYDLIFNSKLEIIEANKLIF